MGRHTTGTRKRGVGARVVLALILVIVAASALVAILAPDSVRQAVAAPCSDATTLHVVTTSSFKPVLDDLRPTLTRGKYCLRLDVKVVNGRSALPSLAVSSADVWIPDDTAWAMRAGEDLLAPSGESGAHAVLATSPIYQVADRETAQRITAAGGTWASLAAMLAGGAGMRLVVPDPDESGDGMVALAALGDAVWLRKGMDSATVASVAIRQVGRDAPEDTVALPGGASEVGLVPEYALIPKLKTTAAQLDALTGSDRTAMLRFTWYPLSAAVAKPDRKAALGRLLDLLKSSRGKKAMGAAGLRAPDGGAPPGVAPGRLPKLTAPPFAVIKPHHVDHVFAAWYPAERKANLLVVVDVSGSMGAAAPGTKTPLIKLVAGGVASVASLLPPDSRLGLWEFGSKLDPPRDYRPLVPSAQLNGPHRAALMTAVGKLAALKTGTGLYDTMLAAYGSAVASYQPGMPNQVLVFTDGVNEFDPGGITLAQLGAQLRGLYDERRPVTLTVAAFGAKSDGGLGKVLKVTNGSVVRVDSAAKVGAVFVHAAVGGLR